MTAAERHADAVAAADEAFLAQPPGTPTAERVRAAVAAALAASDPEAVGAGPTCWRTCAARGVGDGPMTKADQAAADRVLTAAVKRAAAMICDADHFEVKTFDGIVRAEGKYHDRPAVVAMLTAAGETAALLLDGDS